MLILLRFSLLSLVVLLVVQFFFLGEKQSSSLSQVYSIWYQNFKESIFTKRDDAFIRNIDLIDIKRKYYHYNNKLVYYNQAGEINYQVLLEKGYFFSVSEDYYILYQKAGEFIELYDNIGEKRWSLNTFSYPHISPLNNLILLLSTDNTSITLYDRNKNILLKKSYLGSLISDFEFSLFDGSLALGTLDGKIFFYTYLGELGFEKKVQNSKINYIKSVSLSPSGNYLLAIHGLQPEFLSVFNQEGRLIWQNNTQVERRKKTYPFIDEAKNEVYDLRNRSLYIFSLLDGEVKEVIELDFLNQTIDYSLIKTNQGYIGLALNSNQKRIFLLLDEDYRPVWQKQFIDKFFLYLELGPIENNQFEILFHTDKGIYLYQIKEPRN